MRRLPALFLIAGLVAAAVLLAEQPGNVTVVWGDTRYDMPIAVLVLGVLAGALALGVIFWLLRLVLGGPGAVLRGRRERRRREGYRALTRGMVAVAAGDAEEAQKLARKADVLLAEPPLTLLLSAQAAQLKGDDQAARQYFTAMLDRPETEFLGLRGLIMQAMRGGDEATALQLTERAKALRPRTPWVLSSLVDLQARAGRWSEAEATLLEATKRNALPVPESRHHRAVLLYERSRTAEAEGRAGEALSLAAKAHELAPGLAPATVHYVALLRVAGRTRLAAKAIETAWRAAPHPALAEAFSALYAEEPAVMRVKRLERLVATNPDHIESHLAMAAAALAARLWGETRRHLAAAGAELREGAPLPSPRVCTMMAELEEASGGDLNAARAWLGRAAATSTPDATYVCRQCNAESAAWVPLCPHCRAFDTLSWQPPRQAAPGLPSAPEPAPPLPASVRLALPPRAASRG